MTDKTGERKKAEQLVRRWKRDDLCAIDRYESWLSDMAEQGLFLDHVGAYFIYFRRGAPRKTRYRIDVLSRELTADELALYDACGWHLATLRGESITGFSDEIQFYFFETDENATAPELHTDPMEQAESLRALHRQSFYTAWFMLLFTALAAALGLWSHSSRPYGRFWACIYGADSWLTFLCWAFCIYNAAGRWLAVRRLRKRLRGGEPLDHHAAYRSAHRRNLAVQGATWGILAAALVLILAARLQNDDSRPIPSPDWTPDFPAVRLADFQALDGGGAVRGEIRHEWTITGAVIDELTEEGAVDGVDVQLRTACYRLPLPWAASYALEEYKNLYGESEASYARLDTGLVDEAWAAPATESTGCCMRLLVREGRYLVTVFFGVRWPVDFYGENGASGDLYSEQSTERLLSLLAESLTAQ